MSVEKQNVVFDVYSENEIRKFLHTALVIDDCAVLDEDNGLDQPAPQIAQRKVTSPLERIRKKTTSLTSQAPSTSEANSTSSSKNYSPENLNARLLTDAFMREEVICGVHKPLGPDISTELAVKAAVRADIIVVDWILENKNSVKAREIIISILKADQADLGRLRLIAIYTSEPGVEDVINTLYSHIQSVPELQDIFTENSKRHKIHSKDTSICVFNKTGTVSNDGAITVAEGDLPSVLIKEFSKLASGVLPTFAVAAVASVRRGAHHLLTKFPSHIDGAYLAHRALIPVPAEAEDFALNLIAAELVSLVENSGISKSLLGENTLNSWIDKKFNEGHSFKSGSTTISPEVLKDILAKGASRLKGTGLSHKNISTIFYSSEQESKKAAKDFSRLVIFKRESGRIRLEDFTPELTLGSLLKIRRDLTNQRHSFSNFIGDYILCIQPRCDSVRLTESRAFPFQQIKYNNKSFNLIVEEEGHNAYQKIETKPMNTLMLDFVPKKGHDSILAKRHENIFIFKDKRGRVFEWIGDLADLHAQKFASEVGANMHRVGVDDFEWLRVGEPEKPQNP